MFSKKKLIASLATSVALTGIGFVATSQVDSLIGTSEVKASYAWVNSYIEANNITPVGIQYRQGTFNRWIPYENGVGRPEGIVVHETATPGATAENEVAYFNNNWKKLYTYVHAFVDANSIINIHSSDYGVWGAGPTANAKYIQVELCEVGTTDQFAHSISNDAYYIASKLLQYGLPMEPGKTVVSHKQTGTMWHETNHTDPDGYFSKWGYDMNQFNELIGKYYNNLKATGSVNGAVTKPSTDAGSDNNNKVEASNPYKGVVDVTDPEGDYVQLLSFRADGSAFVPTRGLADKTPWATDQQKQYKGHTYYRVSTNEWVSDYYAKFTASK
ncbi:N-acetylmuramoyl-L-alanine amidase family protein [Companilactobacillus mishanensis]|uniref:N-acetylmuramoyl-L-alanine amidase n=1 Tax=Companilactobacillus mishanensis TaxID=2486008 RepID=A0A5P0ZK22_9LACO|nr:N-acetylmuramoyl-L-alanine amidase [Companilactobacillus mishanensis]MQS53408.1 N-acetylmuramoyl-L-alanine amidase [Companilactobacillus mishanensis]